MAEKILQTRIALKLDTLENWGKSSLILKKGELAFATVAASAGTGLVEPVTMVKIGDGEHTFSELSYNFYAKASDVLAACKSEDSLKAFINGVIADAGIATDEALLELAGRVTTAEGKLATLTGEGDGSVVKAIADAIAALDLANTYEAKGEAAKVQSALNTYKEANDIALAGVKATAEAAYVKPVTGIAKEDLSAGVQASLNKADNALQEHQDISHLASKTELTNGLAGKVDNSVYTGKVSELEGAIAGKVAQGDFDTLSGKVTTAEGKITALETNSATKTELGNVDAKFGSYRTSTAQDVIDNEIKASVKAIADDYVKGADIADFETKENVKKVADDLAAYVESNDAAVADRYTKGEADAKFAIKGADAYDDEEVRGLIKANADAIDAIEADYVKAADIADFETKANVQAVADDLADYIASNDEVVAGVKATADAAAVKTDVEAALALKADKSALEATDATLAEVKEVVDNFFSESAVADDVIDTLKDIAAYIATDKEGAADITGRVGALEGKVDVEKVSTAISSAVAAEAERATGVENGLAGRIGALEAVKDDYKAYADKAEEDAVATAKAYTDAEVAKDRERLVVLEGINHEAYVAADAALKAELQAEIDSDVKVVADALAQAKTDISAEIDADVKVVADDLAAYKTSNATELAKKANDADLKAVAKTGLIDDLSIGEGTILVFDCGDATL